jgi:hypothetical protein
MALIFMIDASEGLQFLLILLKLVEIAFKNNDPASSGHFRNLRPFH